MASLWWFVTRDPRIMYLHSQIPLALSFRRTSSFSTRRIHGKENGENEKTIWTITASLVPCVQFSPRSYVIVKTFSRNRHGLFAFLSLITRTSLYRGFACIASWSNNLKDRFLESHVRAININCCAWLDTRTEKHIWIGKHVSRVFSNRTILKCRNWSEMRIDLQYSEMRHVMNSSIYNIPEESLLFFNGGKVNWIAIELMF